jgi:hypothetical protein
MKKAAKAYDWFVAASRMALGGHDEGRVVNDK